MPCGSDPPSWHRSARGCYSFYMSTFLVAITAIHLTKALVIGYGADGDMAGATLYATFAPSEIKASMILCLSFILLPLIGLYVIVGIVAARFGH